jgi:hypothetical protein
MFSFFKITGVSPGKAIKVVDTFDKKVKPDAEALRENNTDKSANRALNIDPPV